MSQYRKSSAVGSPVMPRAGMASRSDAAGGSRARPGSRWSRPDLRIAGGLCLLVAFASLALPLGPAYDSWSWLVWGREVLGLELDTTAGPSWKPLPVAFASLFALTGDAAESLWLVFARTGWLLSLVLAYRLAARLVPAARPARGMVRVIAPVAGAVAALGLLLVDDPATPWLRQFAHGLSEPLAVLACLWAFDRHLDGRGGQAVALATAAALIRPEAWPLLVVYAGHRAWRERSASAVGAFAAVAAAVPALWLLPDLLASGDALTGGDRARVDAVAGGAAEAVARAEAVLAAALDMVAAPLLVAAAVAVVGAALPRRRPGGGPQRTRDRAVLALAAGALAWVAIVAAETVLGYAGLARFLLPAGGAMCVLGGVGVGRLMTTRRAAAFFGKSRRTSRRGSPKFGRRRPIWTRRREIATGPVLAAVLVTVFAVAAVGRAADLSAHMAEAERRGADQSALRDAVAAAGAERLADCGALWVGDGFIGPALAWDLEVPMHVPTPISAAAARTVAGPGVAIVRTGSELERVLRAARGARQLSRAGDWSVLALDCPGLASAVGAYPASARGPAIAGVSGARR